MAGKRKRNYTIDTLPYEENLEKFAPPYTPEKFTKEEKYFLTPFFTNIDRPVFVVKNLPEEVKGALASRYSRSTVSLRRLFLKEYIGPILHPEAQKSWEKLSPDEKKEAKSTSKALIEWMDFIYKNGGIEKVVNIQRGRKFFKTWLAQYGDDSIAELGGELVCFEGVSNVLIKEMQDKRVGISPLEKSTRYVQFWDKRLDGEFQYIVPGELKETSLEKEYKEVMDSLFDTYSNLAISYLDYIKKLYPKSEDEEDKPFENSRSAKRFDDIRDLLPFSTQTSFGAYGNGRAFEDLITRLLNHPLGEFRWWGKSLLQELEKVVPSFVERSKTQRGAEVQTYRAHILQLREELASEVLKGIKPKEKMTRWVRLIGFTPEADVEILSTFLFSANHGLTATEVRKTIKKMSSKKRTEYLAKIFHERRFGREEDKREHDRFRKVPRAFENAHYLFEFWARGGDYRDLQRHRQLTQDRQRFSYKWGYDLEKEVLSSPYADTFKRVIEKAGKLAQKLEKISPDIAQYAIPFGYIQHWYMNMTAREIYWMVELRTGPQGRPHYREVCQQVATLAKKATPAVFQGLLVDMNNYALSRRESEKKIAKKLKQLEK